MCACGCGCAHLPSCPFREASCLFAVFITFNFANNMAQSLPWLVAAQAQGITIPIPVLTPTFLCLCLCGAGGLFKPFSLLCAFCFLTFLYMPPFMLHSSNETCLPALCLSLPTSSMLASLSPMGRLGRRQAWGGHGTFVPVKQTHLLLLGRGTSEEGWKEEGAGILCFCPSIFHSSLFHSCSLSCICVTSLTHSI